MHLILFNYQRNLGPELGCSSLLNGIHVVSYILKKNHENSLIKKFVEKMYTF